MFSSDSVGTLEDMALPKAGCWLSSDPAGAHEERGSWLRRKQDVVDFRRIWREHLKPWFCPKQHAGFRRIWREHLKARFRPKQYVSFRRIWPVHIRKGHKVPPRTWGGGQR